MSSPQIGELRTRVILEAPRDQPDETGAFTRAWTSVASLWSMITPRGADQQFTADVVEAAITHLVTIRVRSDVTNGMRFRLGDRALLIQAVIDPDGRGRTLQCRCQEFAP